MNIRVICLAVMFCVALGGTSLGACVSEYCEDGGIEVSVYTKQARGYQAECCGVWKMKGVCINGISLETGFYIAGKKVYDCPGPSAFLEAMMEEMRRLCKTGDSFLGCADKPLSESIERIECGLTWVTTYCPKLMVWRMNNYAGYYDRQTPLALDMDLLRPVVQMRLPALIIQGFAKQDKEITTTPAQADRITPVKETTTTPAQADRITPVKETTTTPAQADRITPVKETTTTPAQADRITPVKETTTTPADRLTLVDVQREMHTSEHTWMTTTTYRLTSADRALVRQALGKRKQEETESDGPSPKKALGKRKQEETESDGPSPKKALGKQKQEETESDGPSPNTNDV